MRKKRSCQPRGFTLLELLISMSVFLLILMGIYEVFDSSHATYASGAKRVDVQQSARFAMEEMAKRIRLTGYFPENFDADTGNDKTGPIQLATNDALAVYGDLDNSGSPSMVFLFCRHASGKVLEKKSSIGDANRLTCDEDPGADHSIGDITLAQNIQELRFSYFTAPGTNVASKPIPADPVPNTYTLNPGQRQTVQTIVITLVARETVAGQPTQQYTLTSSIQLRNPTNP